MKEEILQQESSFDMLPFLLRAQNLLCIDRCSNIPHIKQYSVAEHSYYCALYGMIFADLENHNQNFEDPKAEIYNVGLVVKKALLHDLEESETGDILYPMHNRYPEFKQKLDEARDFCVNNVLFSELPKSLRNRYIHLWRTSKDNTLEGRLISCIDKFEIMMFAIREISMGNKMFEGLYKNAVYLIKKMQPISSVVKVVDKVVKKFG